MLSFVDLATRPQFAVAAVTCHNDHTKWSAVESHHAVQVVLVRQGHPTPQPAPRDPRPRPVGGR